MMQINKHSNIFMRYKSNEKAYDFCKRCRK